MALLVVVHEVDRAEGERVGADVVVVDALGGPQVAQHACHELGIAKRYTRPYRPQTNGKAERFIQSALREWAYGFTYQRSEQRTAALEHWTHHYNWHRPHQGIGGVAPISRLSAPRENLLTLHS